MATYEIESSSPASDKIKGFVQIMGHEALSMPSVYELTFISDSDDIRKKDILGHFFEVIITFEDDKGNKHKRHCHGHAVKLRFNSEEKIEKYFIYRVSLVSWFGLLVQRVNSRIEQDMTVKEIFDLLIEEPPINQIKKVAQKLDINGKHDKRRYCVQFAESDYHYLARLLEDEGIYYWFDSHDEPGAMHLSDDSVSAHKPLPVHSKLRYQAVRNGDSRFNEIIEWEGASQFSAGSYSSNDSNFKEVRNNMQGTELVPNELELGDFEQFEFPGDHFDHLKASDKRKLRAERLAAERERHWAVTNWADVAVGRTFNFEGHQDAIKGKPYLIASCTLYISDPNPGGVSVPASGASVPISQLLGEFLQQHGFHREFLKDIRNFLLGAQALGPADRGSSAFVLSVLPPQVEQAAIPFRPHFELKKPTMPGPQTAIVVGPEGKELHVDDMGRVKVQFHWDRKWHLNEKATAWIRVSQPWAGQNWGAYFIPRIGQEVIVDFLNGDPDRPIIVGRVYNDHQPIPYKSPTQSGIKTRSTPGGNSSNYNEIMFEDKMGEEKLNIHAELNMSRTVENDDTSSVGNDQKDSVKRDREAIVGRNEKNTVAEIQTNIVGLSQSNAIGSGGQTTHVAGPQQSFFHAGQTTCVKGDQKLIVTTKQDNAIGSTMNTVVGADCTTGIVGDQTTNVGGNSKLVVTSNTEIRSGGTRKEITSGKHTVMANAVEMVANTTLNMMAVGDINTTSIGSNTTVLGSNSSGYIGSNSEANLGITRSTFMGLSMSNALAIDISNFLGLQINNTAAVSMSNTAGPDITSQPLDLEVASLKIISPGAGAAGGAGGAAAGMITAGVLGAASVIRGLFDVAATMEQYQKAADDLASAAKEAQLQGLTGLASRLTSMSRLVSRRRTEGITMAIGGPIWLAGGAVAEMAGGTAATRGASDLSSAGGDSAGAMPVVPPGPVIPDMPAMPSTPAPYSPSP
jgi:type VI secretion system secreted protein VgrG